VGIVVLRYSSEKELAANSLGRIVANEYLDSRPTILL
jgi:hypothetical protein